MRLLRPPLRPEARIGGGGPLSVFGPGCHLHLIDGSGFIFRAYHALPPLTRKSDGLPVGAVAGFTNMVWKMLRETRGADAPTHMAVVFDKSEVTFRNELYSEYKQNRPPAPDDLVPQFRLIRDATRAFNLPCIEQSGFEADDLIATYATQAAALGGRVTIVSADKDLMQLVGPGVDMFDTLKNKPIGPDEVFEKFGVGPDRVIDVQALAGDSVDNVPGAPGIGVKTAAQLISEYGDLDTLLERAGEIRQPKRREVLLGHAEQIRVSRALVTLERAVPLEEPLDTFAVRDPDPEVLLPWLGEMEFRGLAGRVATALGVAPPVIEPKAAAAAGPATPAEREPVVLPPIDPGRVAVLGDRAALADWLARVRDRGAVALAAETTADDEMRAELVGLGMAIGPGEAAYLPLGHVAGEAGLFGAPAAGQVPLAEALALMEPMLSDPATIKVGHNVKTLVKAFARHRIAVAPIDDTMLISYALHAAQHGHGLDYLADLYLQHQPATLKSLTGSGKAARSFAQVPPAEAGRCLGEHAEVIWRLRFALKHRLPFARVTRVYETMERPLVPVLATMEAHGVRVDRQALSRLSGDFAQRMAALEAEIHALAGGRFNVGSPKQLGEVLFDQMGLGGGRKGKTGAYSTGADVLEELAAQGHELPARVLDWRMLSKLKSTYTDTLQDGDQPRDRAGAHLLHDRRRRDRPAGLDRAEPAEHPGQDRGGPAHPRGLRRRGGQCSGQPRLQPDRAPHPRAHGRHPGPEAGVPRRARHPRDDRLRDVRGADRGDAGACPAAGEGDQLRGDLRHLGLRARQQPADPARGREAVHRHLLRALPGHPRVHGARPSPSRRSTATSRRCSAGASTPRRSTPAGRTPRRRSGRRSTPRSRARPPTSSAGR